MKILSLSSGGSGGGEDGQSDESDAGLLRKGRQTRVVSRGAAQRAGGEPSCLLPSSLLEPGVSLLVTFLLLY